METEQTTAKEPMQATIPTVEWLALKNGNILLRIDDDCPGHLLLVADNSYVVGYDTWLRGPFGLEVAKEILRGAIVDDCREQISHYRAIEAAMTWATEVPHPTWGFLKAASTEEPVDHPQPPRDDPEDTR